jgi:hypothetical protein
MLAPKKKRYSRARTSLIFNTTTSRVPGEAKQTEDWPRRGSRDRPILTLEDKRTRKAEKPFEVSQTPHVFPSDESVR